MKIKSCPEFIDIKEVRKLFEHRQPDFIAERAAVNRWIQRRAIPHEYTAPKVRRFRRHDIMAALDADYPENAERLLSVNDAFRIAGRKYPHTKGLLPV